MAQCIHSEGSTKSKLVEAVKHFEPEASPLRRALAAHFERFQGLTAPAPQSADAPIYIDTAENS